MHLYDLPGVAVDRSARGSKKQEKQQRYRYDSTKTVHNEEDRCDDTAKTLFNHALLRSPSTGLSTKHAPASFDGVSAS